MSLTFNKKITFKELMGITLPAVITMVFISMYSIVDGAFISRFVGSDALAALNIVYPIINIALGTAIMLATGGSAIVAIKMGAKKMDEANQGFTLIVLAGLVFGIILMVIGLIFIEPIIKALGATELIYDYCYDYALVTILSTPIAIVKFIFEYFTRTAGHQNFGLANSVLGGVLNIIFDYFFIVTLEMGIIGAALGTAVGYLVPTLISLYYFGRRKFSIYFVKPSWNGKLILDTCINGSSEMVTELSVGIVTFFFNILALKLMGEDGVAAITIILYANFLMTSAYIGFSSGVAPLISYNYGSGNREQIQRIIKYCIAFIIGSSTVVVILAKIFAPWIIGIFSTAHDDVFYLALSGFEIFMISFLFSGINIFTSAMFTAFSNGRISAIVSFLRAFVFVILGLAILPKMFGVTGIWLSMPFAEAASILVSIYYFNKYKNHYGYGKCTA